MGCLEFIGAPLPPSVTVNIFWYYILKREVVVGGGVEETKKKDTHAILSKCLLK